MAFKDRLRLQFCLRMGLLLATCAAGWIGFDRTHWIVIPVLTGILSIVQIAALVHAMEKPLRDLNRFFQAVEYSDFSLTFSARSQDRLLRELHQSFDRVAQAFQKARAEKEAQYRYLQTVVQHVGIGILVYRQDGTVDMINPAARKLFKMPRIKDVDSLRLLDPALPESILSLKPGERSRIQYTDPESGNALDLSMHSAQFVMRNERMTLVAIQNIQSELEEKELEAWQNLIRVLTHEIMNSITPIASLASTANRLVEKLRENPAGLEPVGDIGQAVQTIESRCQGLLKFVQSYRRLTHIPKPEFEIVSIRELFDRVATLMSPRFEQKGIAFTKRIDPETLEITADPNLIEQVLINLLQNALDWAGSGPDGEITLRAAMGRSGHPIISVRDNGPGIEKEALKKIFIPFFTTKPDGSGVGLSLSRQIMMLHRGSLSASSEPGKKTVFTLKF
ncbi:MAG: ATP-binding protein [Acidobacteria bacterium]|nr:ATP-binding protein [Acidobacteriota bacterium]